ncbi:hypothetical protein COCNU_01G000980 [Cocos nucifera]|uniref:Uncharacterized protein n=1 Tax=Cocos nucifera TaxID=13894 RepID=A0A8K0HU31_COCNU|nr:hypothetical protein COCNU_01G000980 [Cocos nucifera]
MPLSASNPIFTLVVSDTVSVVNPPKSRKALSFWVLGFEFDAKRKIYFLIKMQECEISEDRWLLGGLVQDVLKDMKIFFTHIKEYKIMKTVVMVVMDSENLEDVIDLESGTSRTSSQQEGSDNSFSRGNAKRLSVRVRSGLSGLMMSEEAVNSEQVHWMDVYGEAGRCVVLGGFGRVKRVNVSISKRNNASSILFHENKGGKKREDQGLERDIQQSFISKQALKSPSTASGGSAIGTNQDEESDKKSDHKYTFSNGSTMSGIRRFPD